MGASKSDYYRSIVLSNAAYWSDQRSQLAQYKSCYDITFWSKQPRVSQQRDHEIQVETPYGYNHIEQYVSTLFLKQPAVVVGPDPAMSTNDPRPIEILANRWLFNRRTAFENATRLALIYPCAFVKLCATYLSDDNTISPERLLESITVEALNPWDVLVDREASSWDTQRYCGHVYQITVADAKRRYGPKDYSPKSKDKFFTDTTARTPRDTDIVVPEEYQFIQVVELFDLISDRYVVFTTDHSNGYKELIPEGPIPIRTEDDRGLVTIIPLYFTWEPDQPLVGISTMARVYDQLVEINTMRTHMANVVRTNTRKSIGNKTLLDDSAIAAYLSSEDNSLILVDVPQGTQLRADDYITPIKPVDLDQDFYQYMQVVKLDIDQGAGMAPFTRGAVSGTTATEINALSTYADSEIGKMSLEKDKIVERAAELYIRMLYTMLDEDARITLEVSKEAQHLSRDNLSGKFQYNAQDQGNSPISLMQQKQQLLTMTPLLQGLGADNRETLKEIIRLWNLPDELLPPEQVQAPQLVDQAGGQPQGQQGPSETEPAVEAIPPGQEAQPGPEALAGLLGGTV